MKSTFILLTAALLFSVPSFGQLLFSADTSYMMLEANVEKKSYVYVTADRGDALDIVWYNTDNSLNVDWATQFCECSTCFDFEFGAPDSAECNAFDVADQGWYLQVDPEAASLNTGVWRIAIHDKTNDLWDTLTWIASSTASVDYAQSDAEVYAYPNPAGSAFNVDYKVQDASIELQLLSITGEVMTTMVRSGNEGRLTVDLTTLPSGLYIYRLSGENGLISTNKVKVVH